MKDPEKLARQMRVRGWTAAQVREAVERGRSFPAMNLETGEPATRYVHPEPGRSVVIDNSSGEVIHVGGDSFLY